MNRKKNCVLSLPSEITKMKWLGNVFILLLCIFAVTGFLSELDDVADIVK